MKRKSNSYELTGIGENYGRLAEALRSESMMHSIVDNREQFYMPGGKVTLQLRKFENQVFLDVHRTSFFEPSYVGKLVRKLDGKDAGSSISETHPEKIFDLIL